MDQKVTEIRCEQWRRIVTECINRNTEISKRQWCEENGIRYRSLMYWQRKFQQDTLQQMDSSHTALPGSAVQVYAPAFADVTEKYQAMSAHPEVPPQPQENHSFIPELMIQAGTYRVYVSGSLQAATLEKVMQVIGRA